MKKTKEEFFLEGTPFELNLPCKNFGQVSGIFNTKIREIAIAVLSQYMDVTGGSRISSVHTMTN